MTVTLSGSTVSFTGTPTEIGDSTPVTFTVANECGSVDVSKAIVVVEATCVPASVDVLLPDAYANINYSTSFVIGGTAPFTLGTITKPDWMTVTLVGDTVTLTGKPSATASGVAVSIEILNCSESTTTASLSLDVLEPTTVNVTGSISSSVHDVTVNTDSPVPATIIFPLIGNYDDGGTPTEFFANVTVSDGDTSGTLTDAAPDVIECIKESTTGTGTFVFVFGYIDTLYVYTLTISTVC